MRPVSTAKDKLAATLLVIAAAALLVAGLFAAGCSVKPGITQEVNIDEPLGSAAVTDVEIDMGAGKLSVAPGAPGLASGTIRYNVEPWKPVVTRSDTKLTIKQGSQKGLSGVAGDIVNDWKLELGKPPMRLRISAGAYEGAYDLTGLTLQRLAITDGAARSEVLFNSPNPGMMDELSYRTGASTVTLVNLANANFKTLSFSGGAGTYKLDFSGQLRTDASCSIKAAAGSVRIDVPAATAARLTVKGSLNDVNVQGTWTANNGTYTTAAAGNQGAKMLNIELDMSVGSVTLVSK